jgi:DNA mismatch endonuclease (patch repair protein)
MVAFATPRSNRDYWVAKITGNRERDRRSRALLSAQGWEVFTAWECRIKRADFKDKLRAFLATPDDAD